MATLKEHQAAMVDLLANGSGIPASASRLAHAMHDVLEIVANSDLMQFVQKERLRVQELNDATTSGLNDKALSKPQKALKTDSPAKWPTPAEQRVKELENTIKQLRASNRTLRQERDNNYSMWQNEINRKAAQEQALDVGVSYAELGMKYAELVKILAFYGVDDLDKARSEYLKYSGQPEQAGCRKPNMLACNHRQTFDTLDGDTRCMECGGKL